MISTSMLNSCRSALCLVVAVVACEDGTVSVDAALEDGGPGLLGDAGANVDASARDGGSLADAGPLDALPADLGPPSPYGLDERPANSSCLAPPPPPSSAVVQVQIRGAFPALPPFSRLLRAVQAPGDPSRWYVLEQGGRVMSFENTPTVSSAEVFLDIQDRVESGPNEAGLLGLAFHPDFSSNGEVFLSYTANESGQLTSRLSRFRLSGGGTVLDPDSEELILRVTQPFGNHNGGHVEFGPDGFLYLGLGDGGSAGDPQGNGQNTQTLLGALLRIDVDGEAPYGIPPDNPFAQGGGRPEIYAFGLRNPWRWSFDLQTGALWLGDVGQGSLEEVDLIERGGNYGWNLKEGSSCYGSTSCSSAGLIDPVAEYGRSEGNAITGGYVYRGTALPELRGIYVFGDFGSGRIWGLFGDGDGGYRQEQLADTSLGISSFAQDELGEIYVLDLYGGTLHRIEADGAPAADSFPKLLSLTGCASPTDPREPASGMIPYQVNAPLWSDGASKSRWLAVPDGTTIDVAEDGDLQFPVGSVLRKDFKVDGRLVETRLLMRHPSGDWAGYTYEWNEEQTDAALLPAGKRLALAGGGSWLVPSRPECMQCHTTVAGRSLGPELAQLNGLELYPSGRLSNQLATLSHIGMFSEPLGQPPEALPALPGYQSSASLEARARAYLHANCSGCHRPGGPPGGSMDLRFGTELSASNSCDASPTRGDLGVSGARLIAPGAPERSILSLRMHATDVHRMPPLGTALVDPEGSTLVDDWIRSLSGCP